VQTPVVLIHGTNAGPWTMENFSAYFKARDFSCHSPAYRFHDDLRSEENAARVAGQSIADYVEDIACYIETLDEPPILVGHSLGAVVAQKLGERGLARAIVSLNGSIISGVLPSTAQERALGKMFMSAGTFWEGTMLPDFETMAKFGLNKLVPSEQRLVYDRLGAESGRVMFELFFWIFDENQTTKIDFNRVTCPLLFVSATEDLAIPPSTARVIASRYGSQATFHEAEGHGHYLMLEPGWQEIAEVCCRWMKDLD
jgi:non-heme chloroperoxidase